MKLAKRSGAFRRGDLSEQLNAKSRPLGQASRLLLISWIKINVASTTAAINTIKIIESISMRPDEFRTGDGCKEKYMRGTMKTKNGTVKTLSSE